MLSPEQQKIFTSLTKNTRVRIRFAEAADPVWVYVEPEDGVECFNDAVRESIYPATLVDIALGRAGEWLVVGWNDEGHLVLESATRTVDEATHEDIAVTVSHLRELKVIEAGDRWNRRETTIPGLEYTFVQLPDGILEVGCQRIPRAGQEQIVRLLAERLDLEVVPSGTIAAAREACRWIDSPYIDNDCSGDLNVLAEKLPKGA